VKERNPYAPPRTHDPSGPGERPLGSPLELVEIKNGRSTAGRFELFEEFLVVTQFREKEDRRAMIPREELHEQLRFTGGLVVRRMIFSGKRPNLVSIMCTATEQRQVVDMVGPLHAGFVRTALRRPLVMNVLIAVFFIMAGGPVGGAPVDPMPIILGLLLLFVTIAPRVMPHRVLFAVEALWLTGLAAAITKGVTAGDESPWLLLLSLICLSFAVGRVKQFALYAPQDES
jgi:hypothetical protein